MKIMRQVALSGLSLGVFLACAGAAAGHRYTYASTDGVSYFFINLVTDNSNTLKGTYEIYTIGHNRPGPGVVRHYQYALRSSAHDHDALELHTRRTRCDSWRLVSFTPERLLINVKIDAVNRNLPFGRASDETVKGELASLAQLARVSISRVSSVEDVPLGQLKPRCGMR